MFRPSPARSGEGDASAESSTSGDTTAPKVVLNATPKTITAPGTISLSAAANDTNGIKKVVLYSGNAVLSTFDKAPYELDLAVTQADNGTYSFRAEATDPAGNVGKSAAVSVTVNIPGPPPAVPTFVAASAPTQITAATSLALPTPAGIQAEDFLIALIDAEEGSEAHTLTTPAGSTLLGGFPLHNVASAHPPFIIPSSENHGAWIFHRLAGASEPASTAFVFQAAATARGVILGYHDVDPAVPIHDKSAMPSTGPETRTALAAATPRSRAAGRSIWSRPRGPRRRRTRPSCSAARRSPSE